MNYFATNIKFLRSRKKRSQDDVASYLEIPRSTVNSYENGIIINPTLRMLMKFSDYYGFNIDVLIRQDLSRFSELNLRALEGMNQ